jgi:hypothetical protein
METSLTNYQIRHSDHSAVERAVRNIILESAYLSPVKDGWVSLYDAVTDRQNPQEMHRIASTLSAGLGAVVIAFLADEGADVLAYVLYDRGNLRDEYVSRPAHFGPVDAQREARLRGRPEVLWEYCPDSTVGEVEEAFEGPESAPVADPTEDLVSRVRAQFQQTMGGSQPEDVRRMLQMAVDQARFMPPAMVKMMLQSMGIPADDPKFAPLLENPAAFLQSMLLNPEAIKRVTEQFAGGEPAPEKSVKVARPRLTRLAEVLNIDPDRALLSFGQIRSQGAPAFQLIEP